jgi:hypothetical protein
MNRKHVVNVVAVTLMLGLPMSARAQAPAPQPDAAKPAPTQPATQPTGTAAPTVSKLTGEVLQVEGNYLVVKLASGDVQVFNVNPERRFIVDGTPLTIGQLKPGTLLTATYTSTPPVGAAVTTVTGKVWYVMGNTVILTLPDGTNKSFKVPPSYQFMVNGQPASVHDLRKGMRVTADRIPEPPAVAFRNDIEITGTTKK